MDMKTEVKSTTESTSTRRKFLKAGTAAVGAAAVGLPMAAQAAAHEKQ